MRVGSRRLDRAEAVCDLVRTKVPSADLSAWATPLAQDTAEASAAVQLVVAAGAPGVELMPAAVRRRLSPLRVAIDLNAVAPAGLEGIDPQDRAKNREGVISYGALGVGGTKMKIHKAAIRRLLNPVGRCSTPKRSTPLAARCDQLLHGGGKPAGDGGECAALACASRLVWGRG